MKYLWVFQKAAEITLISIRFFDITDIYPVKYKYGNISRIIYPVMQKL